MKVSYNWLREWVAVRLEPRALAERLTLAGLEVGALEPVGGALEQVVVGEILALDPHPDADKLRCARVRVGGRRTLDIVCGASNAAPGMRTAVALPGAVLPNGRRIAETEIRGARSQGMLCSAAELGLEETSAGLIDLGEQAGVGAALVDVLELDDTVLEVELTPNRGDCLSIAGIAREVAALTGSRLKTPRESPVRSAGRASFGVKLSAGRDCPHYVGRVIEDIRTDARSPGWLQERLRRSGVRAIHPVVDVTNYVMMELGQPMHAFDLDRLAGAIEVRHARAGERVTLLDGKDIAVEAGTLLIADRRRVLALAGIMGGSGSGVESGTRRLFLESAYFRPEAIAGRARALGLHTESSHRFERGVDPTLQRAAIERATRLLVEIVGGRPGPVIEKFERRHLPKRSAVVLRPERMNRLLGAALPARRSREILLRLGMRVRGSGRRWRVSPPPYRFDVNREEDLIEEVARVHGYEKLPSRLPSFAMPVVPSPEGRLPESRVRSLLIDRDYQEVITYSFVDPSLNARVDPGRAPARLTNPIASDMAVMRTSLWPGLIQALRHNLNRQQARVRIFEIGRCFVPVDGDYRQDRFVGGVVYGSALAEQWGSPNRPVDFFDLKGDIEGLLGLSGRLHEVRYAASEHAALHPAQAADIEWAGRTVGRMGALHPTLLAELGLEQPMWLFELELSAISLKKVAKFEEISKFPAIRRDLALIIDEKVSAQTLVENIQKVAGNLLVNLELFDEYRGKGIDYGRKSLAVGLTLQDFSRTLKDDEVEGLIERVVAHLQAELGAQLRR